MALGSGKAFNQAVVKALGLEDRSVFALTLRCEVNHAPMLTVEEFLRDGDEMVQLLTEYTLVPKDDAP